jgi:hypothetical protein
MQDVTQSQISVEKIGGTSMSAFGDVLRHIMLHDKSRIYGRIYVVSAYSGVTNQLLEHKKTGERGIYALFAEGKGYQDALVGLATSLKKLNAGYADLGLPLDVADALHRGHALGGQPGYRQRCAAPQVGGHDLRAVQPFRTAHHCHPSLGMV